MGPAHDRFRKTHVFQVEIQSGLTTCAVAPMAVWSGTAVSYLNSAYTQRNLSFRKLHPRSLLERR